MKCFCGDQIDPALAQKITELGAPERCPKCTRAKRQEEEEQDQAAKKHGRLELTPQAASVILDSKVFAIA